MLFVGISFVDICYELLRVASCCCVDSFVICC